MGCLPSLSVQRFPPLFPAVGTDFSTVTTAVDAVPSRFCCLPHTPASSPWQQRGPGVHGPTRILPRPPCRARGEGFAGASLFPRRMRILGTLSPLCSRAPFGSLFAGRSRKAASLVTPRMVLTVTGASSISSTAAVCLALTRLPPQEAAKDCRAQCKACLGAPSFHRATEADPAGGPARAAAGPRMPAALQSWMADTGTTQGGSSRKN